MVLDKLIQVRASADDVALATRLAAQSGVTVSELVRRRLNSVDMENVRILDRRSLSDGEDLIVGVVPRWRPLPNFHR